MSETSSDELKLYAGPPTPARLSLTRTEPWNSTAEHLRFQLDHALARDAVTTELDVPMLLRGLSERGLTGIALQSNAADRRTYLRRPDLGRTLSANSAASLQSHLPHNSVVLSEGLPGAPSVDSDGWSADTSAVKVLFLIADGLSALAAERHALPLLDVVLPLIPNPRPLIPLLHNARVALADPIGELLHAQLTVLLIGERPGLSSPDSLGVYITWNPRPGRTDAERNCISNIRGDAGLSYIEAAYRIGHYISEAQRLQTTGITLKDPATASLLDSAGL